MLGMVKASFCPWVVESDAELEELEGAAKALNDNSPRTAKFSFMTIGERLEIDPLSVATDAFSLITSVKVAV